MASGDFIKMVQAHHENVENELDPDSNYWAARAMATLLTFCEMAMNPDVEGIQIGERDLRILASVCGKAPTNVLINAVLFSQYAIQESQNNPLAKWEEED